MTEARKWFAHAFRNENAAGGELGDHMYFKGILDIYELILPAVEALRTKARSALSETEACVPDASKVSENASYAKDCTKAEKMRKLLLPKPNRQSQKAVT